MESLNPEVVHDLKQSRATRERKLAVCSGGAHLSAADRAEVLTVLAADSDEMVAQHAQDALLSVSPEAFVEAIKRPEAIASVFTYASKNLADKPGIGEALVQNKNCPAGLLVPVVQHLSALGIQALLDDLGRVSDSLALASALEHSSTVTADQKNILKEMHGGTADEAHFAEAAAEAEPDIQRRQTLLQQIAKMTVAQRVQFAVKGGSEARRTLIRDTNKVVQRAVLQSPRLTDQEVEAFASMANLTDEILRLIAANRVFRKNYAVVRNLINNPKLPLDVSLHLLPMINVVDLKKLTMNKNVPETLRTTALKLQRQRAETKK
ncbi:MAG: hypothetical protein JSS69_11275 [Acidobacteria bacterium]|nr:hypothetical protein [Acidobacteriota bacterium]MBS1866484.1 hypothetical protein [Acidobacteriota bacterium]